MRTRVIPAQITTVEDRIAGSLNLTQLLLLMVPVFWTTVEFILLPPKLHVSVIKIVIAFIVAIICVTLSLRIKGKVVLNWAGILLRYNLRPRWYVLNKNETYLREMYLPKIEKKPFKIFKKMRSTAKEKTVVPVLEGADMIRLETVLQNPAFTFFVKTNKKGGLDVGLEQIK